MLTRVRGRLSYANVVASIALFVALGGSAYAVQRAKVTTSDIENGAVATKKLDRHAVIGSKLASDAIAARMIRSGAVGADELAAAAVGAAELADGAVGSSALGDGVISGPKLANSAVSAPKLADGAVTPPAIADESVATAKLADGAVTASKLGKIVTVETTTEGIADGSFGSATAICPPGSVAISGGGFPSTFEMALTTSIKFGNNWRVQASNDTGAEQSLTARAYCLAESP